LISFFNDVIYLLKTYYLTLKLSSIVNHTFAECTMMILSSTVDFVDEVSLNRESFTKGLADGNGDPVLCNLMGRNIINLAYHLCSLCECDR
jgi:hypothetical protein